MDDDLKEVLWLVFSIVSVVVIVVIVLVSAPAYYSSCRSAEIYNDQNHTNYSCGDFFWASGQINSQTQTVKLSK